MIIHLVLFVPFPYSTTFLTIPSASYFKVLSQNLPTPTGRPTPTAAKDREKIAFSKEKQRKVYRQNLLQAPCCDSILCWCPRESTVSFSAPGRSTVILGESDPAVTYNMNCIAGCTLGNQNTVLLGNRICAGSSGKSGRNAKASALGRYMSACVHF